MVASRESQLERYDLLERIAVGGMAEVFLAKAYGAHGFEKTLAIKRILPELARDREFEERFISEAKLAVRLSHANIVQVLDFGRFGGTLFIAMEYVDGLDLAALLQRYRERGRQVPLQAAFHIAVELARGLDYAHQHGVIHRDVSPSNILLSRAGEVKIADFGIAVPDAEELRRPSRRRRIMGKWRYMSPEQTRGEDLHTRSDLFSAAAVLFELFTGDKLFPGDEPEIIIQNIHQMAIPPVADQRPGLPPRLDGVLRDALARDPSARPARAAEMQRALVEISYESSIVATAMDVAEAVAEVLEPAPPRQPTPQRAMALDELIRQQLGAVPVTERHTAVGADGRPPAPGGAAGSGGEPGGDSGGEPGGEHDESVPGWTVDAAFDDDEEPPLPTRPATLIRTGVGADGVTEWDLGDGDNDQPPAGGDEDEPVSRDEGARADEREDAGGESGEDAAGRPTPSGRIPGRPLVLLTVVLGIVAALAMVSAWILGPRGAPVRALVDAAVPVAPSVPVGPPVPPADAAAPANDAPPPRAPLFVMSTPPGAQVWLDGQRLDRITPAAVHVQVDRPHQVELRLDGYEPYVIEGVSVTVEEPGSVSVSLVPTHVSLSVNSNPRGATVRLDGRSLGTTPLSLRLPVGDLPPGDTHEIAIGKRGYHAVIVPSVQLEPGEPVYIRRDLVPLAPRFGTVQIYVENSWADIYLDQEKIGRAPVEALRLPAGKHRLRLHNPVSQRETTLEVVVDPDEQRYYRVEL